LEDDDELADIGEKYKTGKMTTGEVKAVLIKCLQDVVLQHQEKRKLVTDEIVQQFMAVRPIDPTPSYLNK